MFKLFKKLKEKTVKNWSCCLLNINCFLFRLAFGLFWMSLHVLLGLITQLFLYALTRFIKIWQHRVSMHVIWLILSALRLKGILSFGIGLIVIQIEFLHELMPRWQWLRWNFQWWRSDILFELVFESCVGNFSNFLFIIGWQTQRFLVTLKYPISLCIQILRNALIMALSRTWASDLASLVLLNKDIGLIMGQINRIY